MDNRKRRKIVKDQGSRPDVRPNHITREAVSLGGDGIDGLACAVHGVSMTLPL